ncbi:MAG: YhcN/YlaJ family sporulation lipoprotein [Bacillota bacterium]|nr:YhcN/YlaJ family sporulation lipoprotein [Bacillota bacterium]
MQKYIVIASICILTVLAGCTKDISNQGLYQKSGNTTNVNTNRTDLYNEGAGKSIRNVSNNYGYVRHQKSPVLNDNMNNNNFAALNREQLANIISKYSTNIPHVDDVATLVTDREVLIAYHTDTNNRDMTADQVKKTAMSVIPRYFHVYVTDNWHLRRDVEALSYLDSTSKHARNLVNHLIKEMKKSPQGKAMNPSENANGETPDDQMGK